MSNSKSDPQTNGITNKPLPASHKIYVESQRRPDVQVAMRVIHLSNADNGHNGNGPGEPSHAPLTVYDTSGPYTDPNIETDIRQGLRALRSNWILARGDVEPLSEPSYRPPQAKNGNGKHGATERFPDTARRSV